MQKDGSQTRYELKGWKEFQTYGWYLGDGFRPSGHTTAQVETQLKDGFNHIVQGYNDCGYGDGISAAHSYKGADPKGRESDQKIVNGKTTCGASDDASTVDFNALPSGVLASTCTYRQNGDGTRDDVDLADIRFNSGVGWAKSSSGCSGQYDLRSVATHEAGHVFGLEDLSGPTASALTMYYRTSPCQFFKRTLGNGDMKGLRALY